jgi:hypothetical protein
MPKTKISEYDATAANNTDVNSINIAEGCAPSGINNAIRQVMADLKDFQQGTKGDAFLGPVTPSTLTLTGLTANRILYTNGSKQVATSDNVQFDGTTLTVNTLSATSITSVGGSINGMTIGASTPSTGAFTSLTDSGNLTFTGTGNRILGDFSNGTIANRVQFQSSTVNGNTNIATIPNGTSASSAFASWNNSNQTNASFLSIGVDATTSSLTSGVTGSGTLLPMLFVAGGAERIRITTDGNVGLGTPTPTANLHVRNTSGNATFKLEFGTGGTQSNIIGANAEMSLQVAGASAMTFYTNSAERMRIDSSGVFYVNATTNNFFSTSNSSFMAQGGATGQISGVSGAATNSGTVAFWKRINGAGNFHVFYVGGASPTDVGSISTNGTTTAYTTTSDYRLKENIAPMTGALATVSALKPVTYKWKSTGETSQGFIAHELQAVVPDCVTGEKDAIDVEGKPVYQGIDTSFLVATLTAAIQELKAEFDAYKATHP